MPGDTASLGNESLFSTMLPTVVDVAGKTTLVLLTDPKRCTGLCTFYFSGRVQAPVPVTQSRYPHHVAR